MLVAEGEVGARQDEAGVHHGAHHVRPCDADHLQRDHAAVHHHGVAHCDVVDEAFVVHRERVLLRLGQLADGERDLQTLLGLDGAGLVDVHLAALSVEHDSHRVPALGIQLADALDDLRVPLVRVVAQVEARAVHAALRQRLQHLGGAGLGADGADDLGAPGAARAILHQLALQHAVEVKALQAGPFVGEAGGLGITLGGLGIALGGGRRRAGSHAGPAPERLLPGGPQRLLRRRGRPQAGAGTQLLHARRSRAPHRHCAHHSASLSAAENARF
mmetsp:Transcript_10070/g.25760  ORF Transcript_10070/g.25760 Transcript_10070/m.25760 type:complete len:274 (-) Transcript_10070:156-977(-)